MLRQTKHPIAPKFPDVQHIDNRHISKTEYLKLIWKMQMVVLQICTCSNGIKVRIAKAYCKISVMAVFMRKNKPFVPYIGSLSLCCWIILGHIGRGGLESREDDISLSAWVSGLRGRFQKGRKCLCMYLFLLWNILANQDMFFMNAVDELMLFKIQ